MAVIFSCPRAWLCRATQSNLAMFEARRAELEAAANERKSAAAETPPPALAEVSVTLVANASDEGKLFGSVGPREIADAVTANRRRTGKE